MCRAHTKELSNALDSEEEFSDKFYVYGSKYAISTSAQLSDAITKWSGDVILFTDSRESTKRVFDASKKLFLLAVCDDINTEHDGAC